MVAYARLSYRTEERSTPLLRGHTECEFDLGQLTAREFEIARLVAKGLSNKEVGQILEISHWTVAAHLKATFLKLGVRRRGELTFVLLGGP